MQGADEDYGTSSSWQSQESEIRTDTIATLQELPETLHETTTCRIPEDDSSEESFELHTGHNTKTQDYIICLGLPHHSNDSKDEDKQYNKPFKDRQLDHIWGFTQIMILAPCLEEKNSDMVHLGYCNVVGISAKVVSNSKVNAIRKYAHKNDLDGFLASKQILIGKACHQKDSCQSFFLVK
jgi:hypothetical protein